MEDIINGALASDDQSTQIYRIMRKDSNLLNSSGASESGLMLDE